MKVAEELFSGNGISENMPTINLSKEKLDTNILDLLVETSIATSKSEARRLVEQNGISINKIKEKDITRIITKEDLEDNSLIIQKGKKVFIKVIFE